MKMLAALSLLMASLLTYAQPKDSGYTVTIHVSASRIAADCGVFSGDSSCKTAQQLTVLIDGAKYEIESETFFPKGIVALGDYKAKLIEDQQKPTHEFSRAYELMFPDGSTRKFRVIGQFK